ncbi:hypothetical protein TBLA_0D00370 [Henningerozyma blattae CBS 6284]|uniref:Mitochondrial import receptor subunit TOM22 n=1 Tax=Henningerozyma blattae (strain ATCC 34711 / CBS 6284 / DSM 70876 / NBRC 10599 / NRRL Y-10934 / UCD 77-7) TaxID=1071380 RepID=I2H2E5_HENB6|nr:hypothetical protein TBLA_0D00370 [Tetrapisispora blattae CBS 6284]CCH60547.1 hypothetical protein TBLA_0D00370 [Tetrapisispora blattae CBS 6284]
MVELTEVRESGEDQLAQTSAINDKGPLLSDINDNDDKNDDDDDDDDDDDSTFDQDETIWERIEALKDMVPPKQRHQISGGLSTIGSTIRGVFNKSFSLTWIITTSALLLGVPLSLSILAEQQLIEMERSFDLQKDANELLGQQENKESSGNATATA